MSDYESDMNDFSIPQRNSFQSDPGLPREVFETLNNFSVLSRCMLFDDLRALQDEFREEMVDDEFREEMTLLQESPIAYFRHQTVAENVNNDLSERLSGLTTAHLLVCLKRDDLRRFKRIVIPLLVVLVLLIILILLGIVAYKL